MPPQFSSHAKSRVAARRLSDGVTVPPRLCRWPVWQPPHPLPRETKETGTGQETRGCRATTPLRTDGATRAHAILDATGATPTNCRETLGWSLLVELDGSVPLESPVRRCTSFSVLSYIVEFEKNCRGTDIEDCPCPEACNTTQANAELGNFSCPKWLRQKPAERVAQTESLVATNISISLLLAVNLFSVPMAGIGRSRVSSSDSWNHLDSFVNFLDLFFVNLRQCDLRPPE